jgi:hypothetical protein
MDQTELLSLLTKARELNATKGITGLLLYKDGYFVQILEGAKDCLNALLNKIRQDSRHHGVVTISEGEVLDREFSSWAMGFRELSESNLASIPGFTAYMNDPHVEAPTLSPPEKHRDLIEMFRASLSDTSTNR